jgi:hypothetical protein
VGGSSFVLPLRGAVAVVVIIVEIGVRPVQVALTNYDTVMVQPVPVVLVERDIESVHTQVIVQTYSDRILVIVTQLQKVGTLVRKLCSYSSLSTNTA